MKKLALIFCLLFLFVPAPPLQAAPPAQTTPTLTLTNESEATICTVLISPTTAAEWGEDWLAEQETIPPGRQQIFKLPPGSYNINLLACDGTTLLDKRNLSITGSYELSLTGSDPCETLNQAALALYRQANYPEALEQFQQAHSCYQQIGDQAGEGTTLNNIGEVYRAQGRYSEALASYQQVLTIRRQVGDRAGEGTTLNNIGAVHYAQGRYGDALTSFQQALTIHRQVGDRTGESVTLNNLGAIYANQGRYSNALTSFQQVLTILREIGDRTGEGTTLNNIGGVYHKQGRYSNALASYQQALTITRQVGDRATEGITLNNIGAVYANQGRYGDALASYQQVLAILRDIGNRAGEGITLNNIGAVYANQGRYGDALASFQQALTITREVGDRAGESAILYNIGGVYDNQGRYSNALASYQQALTIRREVGDRAGEGQSLNNIGAVYSNQGRYGDALASYQQALAITREVGDRAGEGATLASIGLVYHNQGRYGDALDSYKRALTILREVGDRAGEGATLHNIGLVYHHQGRYGDALDSYQQALTIRREVGDRAGEGQSLNNIGGVYDNQGRYGEALDSYQQALTIIREMGNRAEEGTTLNNIGEVYRAQGRYADALDNFQQALTIHREVNNRPMEGTTLNNIGVVYHAQGQSAEALESYQQAVAKFETIRATAGSEAGRASFIAQYIFVYQAVVDLLHQQGQPEAAFFATEQGRARAFLDSLATGQVQLADTAAAELLAQEQELYARRQALQDDLASARAVQPPEPEVVAALEAQVAEAETAYAAAQKALAGRSAELADLAPGRSQNVLGLAQVQPLLDEQTTLLAYFVLADKTLAFLISHDSFQSLVLEVSRAALADQIQSFRDFASLAEAQPESVVTLYNWLVKPLKPHLTTSHLVIIPHNVLHYLPFAALTDGNRYLIDDYTLTTLPNASSLPFIQENTRQTTYSGQPLPLVLGNPVMGDYDPTASLVVDQRQYRDQFGPLPFAEKEAQAIAELFGVEPLIGPAATESAVREQVSQANILHLAAHGQFNPVAPLNSLIALAPDHPKSKIQNPKSVDGWLTVGEVYGVDLKKTDLVVLSACETNLGDLSEGDELVGLTRAFIFAGTPSVMASLWKVEDEATSLLMERFYTHLKEGMGKAEALRQAQLEVREEYPNPYYWAAFVLSGE